MRWGYRGLFDGRPLSSNPRGQDAALLACGFVPGGDTIPSLYESADWAEGFMVI